MNTLKPLLHNSLAPLAMAAALMLAYPAQGANTRPAPIAAASSAPMPAPARPAASTVAPAMPATAAPAPVAIVPSQLQEAFVAAMREIQAAQGEQSGLPQTLDLFPFHYSPATAQQLFKIFGNDQPLTVAQTPAPKDGTDYLATLQPLDFVDSTGMHVEWSAMTAKVSADKARRNVSFSGAWPAIGLGMKDFQVWYRDISFDGKQTSADGKLWFGNSDGRFGSVSMDMTAPVPPVAPQPGVPAAPDVGASNPGPGPIGPHAPAAAAATPAGQRVVVTMDDVRYKSAIVRHGKAADLNFATSIKTINVAQEHVDDVNVAVRLVNLDLQTLRGATDALRKFNAESGTDGRTPEQQVASMLTLFKTYGKSALLHGASLAIDDISAGYRGHTASLKGQLGFSKLVESDFGNAVSLVKKLVARFEVRVPVAMIDDVAGSAARHAGSAGTAAVPPGAGDAMVKAALSQGWVRVENGEVRATIEVKNGKLTVNGKEIPLPGFGAAPPRATPPTSAPAPAPARN